MVFAVKDLVDSLKRLAGIFDELSIRHHFTGGLVSSFYGEPRLTQDIDVVVDPLGIKNCFADFVARLDACYIFNSDSIKSALSSGGVFQLLDTESLIKIDLYPRQMVPGELQRSVIAELLPNLSLRILSKEDAIIAKLLWIQKGSHKSRKDVRMMMKTSPNVDVQKQAESLGLSVLLDQVLEEDELLE